MKRKWLTALMLVMLGSIYGCNTMEGAGKDIERGGEKVQDSAKDTKNKM
jgi:predicted small secreted protein